MSRVNITNIKVSKALNARLGKTVSEKSTMKLKKASTQIKNEILSEVSKEIKSHEVALGLTGQYRFVPGYDLPAELGFTDADGRAVLKTIVLNVANNIGLSVEFSPKIADIQVRTELPSTEQFSDGLINITYTSQPSGEEIRPLEIIFYPWVSVEEYIFGEDISEYSIVFGSDFKNSRSKRAIMVHGRAKNDFDSRFPYTSPVGARPERRSQENFVTEALSSKNIRLKLEKAVKRALRTR